jgi:hypothetical protein
MMLDANGAFRCENTRCGLPLGNDPVIVITTGHVRRFCDLECVCDGHDAHVEQLLHEIRVDGP